MIKTPNAEIETQMDRTMASNLSEYSCIKNDDNGETWDAEIGSVRKYKARGFWTLSQYEKIIKNNEINDKLED